ncbi:hypothetical protein PA598K_03457 [Paenibacillus sp. 598K]|uniref:sugar kinase n=1 Tax=Paenibacillus sp. 598K TaxID=1117987 RepID=UPI000FF9888D|nr:sugar kinase [Paenibacillus sp. 598K]GBF75076.1 hypothetical protein PA598K_03457 [Paenibacillus sp. 598K]
MSGASSERKVVLVKRQTRLEELVKRNSTVQQAQFYVERLGADFGDYRAEDERYRAAVAEAVQTLESEYRLQVIDRAYLPNFIFGRDDIVVAIGPDGLIANTLKYLDGQPLIGVNPDPLRWDGVLLPFRAGDLRLILRDVARGRRPMKGVTLAKAELNDGQTLYAVNDLFIGRRSHVSARYELSLDGHAERQSSSGIIVSTGLGSTGWLKSVLAGAAGILRGATGYLPVQALELLQGVAGGAGGADVGESSSSPRKSRKSSDDEGSSASGAKRGLGAAGSAGGDPRAAWAAEQLYFAVREPFPSRTTSAELVFGQISAGAQLRVVSEMPEDGVIFSDGVESDFLVFQSGVEARIGIAERQGCLVV